MDSLTGTFREKLGRTVHKAILLRYQGEVAPKYPQYDPTGKPFVKPVVPEMIKSYQFVAGVYYTPRDVFFYYGKGKDRRAYELHLQNTCYERKEVNIQYIDYDTGGPVPLGKADHVTYPPNVLAKLLMTTHINAAYAAAKGMNSGWIIPLILFGFGITMGLLIGMNSGAISHAITPGPTPTPTPFR